jgi:hypothetical protein
MANQERLWSDPKVRAERQAKAEAFMGRPMELDTPDGLPCGEGCAECRREKQTKPHKRTEGLAA